MRDNTRLFRTLGVTKAATAAEVEEAYAAIRQRQQQRDSASNSLSTAGDDDHHGDVAGSGETDAVEKARAAYRVLRNPIARGLYTRLGEFGLCLLDFDTAELHVTLVGRLMLNNVVFAGCWILAITTLLLGLMLVCMKIEGDVAASWAATLLPFWLAGAVRVTHHAVVGLRAPPPALVDARSEAYRHATEATATLVGWVATAVAVVLRLDGVVAWPWVAVFAPAYATLAVGSRSTLRECSFEGYSRWLAKSMADLPPLSHSEYAFRAITLYLRNVLLAVLLTAKLEGRLAFARGYYVATLPLVVQPIPVVAVTLRRLAHNTRQRGGSVPGALAVAGGGIAAVLGVFLVQYILLVEMAEGRGGSMYAALTPTWIVAALAPPTAWCLRDADAAAEGGLGDMDAWTDDADSDAVSLHHQRSRNDLLAQVRADGEDADAAGADDARVGDDVV